ncbi:MAG: hypothetical protein ACRDQ4_27790 [Pseudonocardiaceae bacterium]
MNNPRPASSASPSLQQTTVGPGDPTELRLRMTDRLLAGDNMAPWSVAVAPWRSALATVPRHEFIPDTVWIKNPSHWPTLPARSPQPAGSATREGTGP